MTQAPERPAHTGVPGPGRVRGRFARAFVRVRPQAADGALGIGRAVRSRARRAEALSERIVLFTHTREALRKAEAVLARGWVQHAWIVPREPALDRTAVAEPGSIAAACVVAAVVLGGGGPSAPATRRGIDAIWQAVFGGASASATWVPAPSESALRVNELIAWNDAPGRSQADALNALARARRLVDDEVERLRGLLHSA